MSHIFAEFPLAGLDYGPDHDIYEINSETWATVGGNAGEGRPARYTMHLGDPGTSAKVKYNSAGNLFSPVEYVVYNGQGNAPTGAAASTNQANHVLIMFKVDVATVGSYIEVILLISPGSTAGCLHYRIPASLFSDMGIPSGVAYVLIRPRPWRSSAPIDVFVNGQLARSIPQQSTSSSSSITKSRLVLNSGTSISGVTTAIGYLSDSSSIVKVDAIPTPAWLLRPNFSVKRLRAVRRFDVIPASAETTEYKPNSVTVPQINSGFKLQEASHVGFETDYVATPGTQALSVQAHATVDYVRRSPKFGACWTAIRFGNGGSNGPEHESSFATGIRFDTTSNASIGLELLDVGVTSKVMLGYRKTKVGQPAMTDDLKYMRLDGLLRTPNE